VSKKFTLTDSEPRIREFLDLVINRAGFTLKYAVSAGETVHPDFENPDVLVRFTGQDVELLLANKAELLLAIEQQRTLFRRAVAALGDPLGVLTTAETETLKPRIEILIRDDRVNKSIPLPALPEQAGAIVVTNLTRPLD